MVCRGTLLLCRSSFTLARHIPAHGSLRKPIASKVLHPHPLGGPNIRYTEVGSPRHQSPTAAGFQLHLLARHYNAAGLPCDFMIIVCTLPFFEASTGMPKLCLILVHRTFSHDFTCPDLYEAFVLWSFYKCMVDSFVSSDVLLLRLREKGRPKMLAPCCCFRQGLTFRWLQWTTLGVVQYVFVRVSLSILILIAALVGASVFLF